MIENPAFIDWICKPDLESDSYWKQWILDHPDRKEEFDQAVSLLSSIQFKNQAPPIDASHVFEKINKRKAVVKPKGLYIKSLAAVAAMILVLVYFFLPTSNSFETPFAKMDSLELPDGSEVTLNANSSIKMNTPWKDGRDREIWLEGEAYFNITDKPKQGSANFIVHTSKGDVHVLGTQFYIKDRQNAFHVMLSEGNIEFKTKHKDILKLEPGSYIAPDHSSKRLTTYLEADTTHFSSWKSTKIHYKGIAIEDLEDEIYNLFGYKFNYEYEAFKVRPFTGYLSTVDLQENLLNLELSFGIKTHIEDNIITISKK